MRTVFAISSNDAAILKAVGIDSVLLHNPIVPWGQFLCEGQDLLYVGRISDNKRINLLIPFMAALTRQDPGLKLHIVGSDQEELWPGIAAEIQRQGLADNILYYGYLETEQVLAIARSCGFTVSASRYEGFGLSVIEGMSVGLIPLMHRNEAFRETFERSHSGLLVDFDDPAAAARAFADWRGGVTRQDRLQAQRFAHQQSWDAAAETYQSHYESP